MDGTTAYEFSGDGNGALLLPNVTYEFTYKIKKDQISIDYENESVRDGTYSFSVENNTLTLNDGGFEGPVRKKTPKDEDLIVYESRRYRRAENQNGLSVSLTFASGTTTVSFNKD